MSSVYPNRARGAWIVAQRGPRASLDAFKPHGFFLEQERTLSGRIVTSATILLINKECPWRCLMCDLWKNTLTHTVPRGAIPAQIHYALSRLDAHPEQIKLYNSGSFFDSAAIPLADYEPICREVGNARHLIVESHPRLIGSRVLRLRDNLNGTLEVAMGLETVHPVVLPRLNKNVDLGHFEQAAAFLRREQIDVRAFVLVQPPFLEESEALEWAVRSADFAFSCGASVVSLVPTRPGNGALDRLIESGEFSPPRLATLEKSLVAALGLGRGRVFADTWDLEKFSNCPACFAQRRQRLCAINLGQQLLPPIACSVCDGS